MDSLYGCGTKNAHIYWHTFDGGQSKHLTDIRWRNASLPTFDLRQTNQMTCQLTNNFCWQTGDTTYFIWDCVIRVYDTLLNITCHRTCFLTKTFSIACPHTLLPFCSHASMGSESILCWLLENEPTGYLKPILSAPRGRHFNWKLIGLLGIGFVY